MLYTHLTPFERAHIEVLLQAGWPMRRIARDIGRSPSTVARERARNRNRRGHYSAVRAQAAYRQRRMRSVKPCKLQTRAPLRLYVEEKLRENWSPKQIVGTLPKAYPRDPKMRVSHETIYAHVYADKRVQGTLYEHLRHAHRKRRRRMNAHAKRGLLPGRVGIEKRPKSVESRRCIGHWEGDLVLGRQSGPAIVTLVERKSGMLLARKVETRRAYRVGRVIIDALHAIAPKLVKTITFDNGKEFADFKAIETTLNTRIYFADPYAAWQRGTNENTNGLLRQYIPKKTDLHTISQHDLNCIVQALNNRPRERLNYRTPAQLFEQATVALQL